MGYAGKLDDKNKAQQLRREGLSYNEIRNHVTVSKDTLSRWCKDIILTENQKQRLLTNKKLGQKKGSLVAADNKRNARLERVQQSLVVAKKQIGMLSSREKLLVGAALYAGEGYKMDGNIGFANADPQLISFMMDWFLTVLKVPMDRIRGAIWLHEGLNEKVAKEYWSSVTGIPDRQFHKTYIATAKKDSKKVRKNIHQHGVFAIRISDSKAHRQIMGWISAIVGDKIGKR